MFQNCYIKVLTCWFLFSHYVGKYKWVQMLILILSGPFYSQFLLVNLETLHYSYAACSNFALVFFWPSVAMFQIGKVHLVFCVWPFSECERPYIQYEMAWPTTLAQDRCQRNVYFNFTERKLVKCIMYTWQEFIMLLYISLYVLIHEFHCITISVKSFECCWIGFEF